MFKIMKRFFVLVLLTVSILQGYGQDNIGTPYSVYGFGLQPDNIGPYSAMGGVSAGLRDNYNINYLNPASYTALSVRPLQGCSHRKSSS